MNQILHCDFGIIVFRGEPGSIILQPKMHLVYMDPLLIHLPLVMKATSQICANMHGMNGVASEIKQRHFPTTRKF